MYMRSGTVSNECYWTFQDLLFSDISFLCEATTAIMTQEQQKKPSVPQRTTDKSAIRAIQHEVPHDPVCDNLEESNKI
jgi:hypothetical protein